MIGVTIGIGDTYRRYATCATNLAIRNLGLDKVIVIGDDDVKKIPSLMKVREYNFRSFITKFYIFDITKLDRFIYFDCDAAFVTTPPTSQLDIIYSSTRFLAVRDRPYTESMARIEENVGVPKGTYVNAGMFVANKEHKKMFDILKLEADLLYDKLHQIEFQDQYLLNAALNRFSPVVHTQWLHRYWNAQDWHEGWGILPFAIHSCNNYNRYDGRQSFPNLPQGVISKPFRKGDQIYTADGFVFDNTLSRITKMYHLNKQGEIITYA